MRAYLVIAALLASMLLISGCINQENTGEKTSQTQPTTTISGGTIEPQDALSGVDDLFIGDEEVEIGEMI